MLSVHSAGIASVLAGDEGRKDMLAYGEQGVRFYTRQKSIIQRPESTAKGAGFIMPTLTGRRNTGDKAESAVLLHSHEKRESAGGAL